MPRPKIALFDIAIAAEALHRLVQGIPGARSLQDPVVLLLGRRSIAAYVGGFARLIRLRDRENEAGRAAITSAIDASTLERPYPTAPACQSAALIGEMFFGNTLRWPGVMQRVAPSPETQFSPAGRKNRAILPASGLHHLDDGGGMPLALVRRTRFAHGRRGNFDLR